MGDTRPIWKISPGGRDSVVLVSAPFLSVLRPALGVSNLKAALTRTGIAATVDYCNLRYAKRIGVDRFQDIADSGSAHLLAGEWVFTSDHDRRSNPELEARYLEMLRQHSPCELTILQDLREGASDFVEASACRLADSKPAVVGFSTTFQQNRASLAIARRLRELDPDILICFGGANCEGPMGRALAESFPQIDFVFSGESEQTFPDFVECYLSDRPYRGDPAVYWRGKGDDSTAEASPLLDLDALPIPDFQEYFDTLQELDLRQRIRPTLLFETSRGCWWGAKRHCTFCGLNGGTMAYRSKSAERILKEIDQLAERWDIQRFEAADNILNTKHIGSVFDVLADRPENGYHFFYEIKSNLSHQQLARAARGGLTTVQPGIESLSDEVLELMAKGVTGLQNIRFLRNCEELGVRAVWNLIWGFPGERPEHYANMARMIELIEHLPPPTNPSRIRLDRFSPNFERAEEFGFQGVRPFFAYEVVYDLPSEILWDLAYFFEGIAPGTEDAHYIAPVEDAIARWRRAHYETDSGVPMLRVVAAGPLMIVKDTRSCATQELRLLTDEEVSVLLAFRDPAPIKSKLAQLQSRWRFATTPAAVLEQLVDWGLVLIDRDRALNLCTDPSHVIHELTETVTNDPGGNLIPPGNEGRTRPSAEEKAFAG